MLDNMFGPSELKGMECSPTIAATAPAQGTLTLSELRRDLGFTLLEMGAKVGLSKSQMHEIERTGRATVRVAVKIERLSDGQIDAATLSDDVKLARHGNHPSPPLVAPSPDKPSQNIGSQGAAPDSAASSGRAPGAGSEPEPVPGDLFATPQGPVAA